jgi:N-methylhydantoinase B/oxoprolinase/acetone carboxylase alpha subunit
MAAWSRWAHRLGEMAPGDVFEIYTPGGGGFGTP